MSSRSHRKRSRSSSYRRRRSSRDRRRRSSSRSRTRHDQRHKHTDDHLYESSFESSDSPSEDESTTQSDVPDANNVYAEPSSTESSSTITSSDEENEVEVKDQGTSPIRWVSPSQSSKSSVKRPINIAERRGWKPSLGPQMFNIAREGNQTEDTDSETTADATLPHGSRPSPHIPDTDI